MYQKAFKDLRGGLSLFHVWFYQAYHNLEAKYKRTLLGSLWIAGSMVATSLAMAIVWGGLFGQDLAETLPYIMGGILVFTMVSFVFGDSPELFLGNAGIISNHAYPFTFYVFEGMSKSLLTFLHNLVVYQIAMALLGKLVVPHYMIIAGLMIVLVTLVSWGTLIGMLAARFRDVRFLLPYLSQLIFFTTPIFYRAEQLTGWRRIFVDYNPFYGLVEVIRGPLLGVNPPASVWFLAISTMVAGIIMWLAFFPPFRKRIPFWM